MELQGQDENGNPTHQHISMFYPIISGESRSTVEIELLHVRAADSIRVSYDGERDGWSIEQASIFQWDADDNICDPDWQEVAFVQAWARESLNA